MQDVTVIGIDLGKRSFHLHGQDKSGKAVFRKKVLRQQLIEFFSNLHVCSEVMEASAGAHFIAHKLASFGHQIRLVSRRNSPALS
ncbi:IS110 family transposase ISBcen1 [Paraburkholderia humisilvae]|uniref:IS110 family transposase ISBcen1 n=1 Tax=Paraburkholderia humisilvae TaxID=627669 RepID=A0A6J5F8L0_9BURK|nr:IS110 family transposase ISBcen1 [Paraburkholderia humisilvae]